jgi:hypothetical protein
MTDTPPVSSAPNAGPRAAMNSVRQPRAIELKLSDQRNLRRAFTGTWRFQISVSSALNDVRDRELTLAELETVVGGDPSTGCVYAEGGYGGSAAGSSGGVVGLVRLIARILS